MRLGAKFVVAAVSLGVLSSPSATATVLDHARGAFTAVRDEAASELATLTGDRPGDRAADGTRVSTVSEAARRKSRRGGAGSYRFTVRDGQGRPGRWDPCRTIPIVVNPAGAPARAMRDLRGAVTRVNAVSGLRFAIVGTTTARPDKDWGTVAWSGSPEGWAPVIVAFGSPGTGYLKAGESGVATPVWVDEDDASIFVSGSIVFNARHNHLYQPGFRTGGTSRGALFEHELGHLAGLDHVDDPRQVMYPETGYASDLGAGDRRGLKALGKGGCLETPDPGWNS